MTTFKELPIGAEFTFDAGIPFTKDKPMVKLAVDAYRHFDGRELRPSSVHSKVTLF